MASTVCKRKNIGRLSSAIGIVGILVSICSVPMLFYGAMCNAAPNGQYQEAINLVEAEDDKVFGMPSLQPEFRIPDLGVKKENIEFYIDGSQNIMGDPFMRDEVHVATQDGYLTIRPQFSLYPRLHEIRVVFPTNGSKQVINKKLILAYADHFSSPIGFKRFWGTSDNWYITEDYKLRTDIGKDQYISDISFRRDFPNDVVIEFDFVPFSDAVNISVFLGEGFSFFIGDGDNLTVRLKKAVKLPSGRKKSIALESQRLPFRLKKGQTYRARVTRIANTYRIFISDKPELRIEKQDPVFAVTDKEPEARIVEKFHTVGLAVWKGTGLATTTGAMFDNVVIYEPTNTHAMGDIGSP